MSNTYGIPTHDESEIRERDKLCVYCSRLVRAHAHTRGTPTDKATIEHLGGPPFYPLYYKEPDFDRASIAICCGSCNSSRGGTPIIDWFATPYCIERGINAKTVAPVVQQFIGTRRYDQYQRAWWARRPQWYRDQWRTRQARQVGLRA